MLSIRLLCVAIVASLFLSASSALAAHAAGTWKWKVQRQGGEEREMTLKLKEEGEKLTGTITGFGNTEAEITDGKIDKENKITFKVVRKRNDQEVVSTYVGTLDGDTIKGKSTTKFGDQEPRERDWEAKRAKDEEKKD